MIMKNRFYLTIGLLFILAGLFISAPFLIPAIKSANQSTANAAAPVDTSHKVVSEEPVISGQPTHIEFPSVKISVDIIPGYFDAKTNSWTLTKDKAQYATVTDQPNNKTGNTFIYGHNRWQVFTGLLDAKVGDEAIVTTANGHTFTYKLRTIEDVDPTNTQYLQTHNSPILTVQTCSGIWYEHRRMFTFDLVKAI
jgi:LPXTG-site transpeptidase (sortase) family protein